MIIHLPFLYISKVKHTSWWQGGISWFGTMANRKVITMGCTLQVHFKLLYMHLKINILKLRQCIIYSEQHFLLNTVNVTGETLVLKKIFPGFMVGNSFLYIKTKPIFPTLPA